MTAYTAEYQKFSDGISIVNAKNIGWTQLKNYFDGEIAKSILNDIDILSNNPQKFKKCMYFFGTDNEGDRRLVRIERLWESLPTIEKTGLGARIVADAEAFLGGPVQLFKDKVNIRYAGSKGYAPHQDSAAGWEEFADRFVSIGLFLHPSDPYRGGFEVVSGAHNDGRFSNEKGRMSEEVFQALKPTALVAEQGDAVLLDSEAPHKTLDNQSDQNSVHLLFTFARVKQGDIRSAYYDEKERSFAEKRNGNEFEFRVFAF
ncbi:phytanoyl-CoA dioxygenase family protein [Roseibium sp. AS2]|uniref:phytanoyl-CoA dioxygenase family protein n=1 Tax=Roseibium sp. AS2 TaxID=3135781 RepID=UPI00316F1E3B